MSDDWDHYYPDYPDFEPEPEELPRDPVVDEVKEALKDFFKNNRERVFYFKQIEVMFEKRFFHWITETAINELVEEGYLGKKLEPLFEKTRVNFVFSPPKWRYYKRAIANSIEVIREYAHHTVARGCGEQADVLFFNAFMGKQFLAHGQDVNEYAGKKWTETKHNLDFILEKDGKVYGCEVKNTFDYIPREELSIKLNICSFLGIRPLFIMRYSPKPYNYEIIKRKGFALIFETQIYPFGHDNLVKRIKDVLGLPVDCPRAIPAGIIERFMKWHNAQP